VHRSNSSRAADPHFGVQLRGLYVDVPPRQHIEDAPEAPNKRASRSLENAIEIKDDKIPASAANSTKTSSDSPGTAPKWLLRFQVEGVECTDAH